MPFLKIMSTLTTGLFITASMVLPAQASGEPYSVELNTTQILRLPEAAGSIIIGNPSIADVTVQSVDTLFVIGRGFGETNMIILDTEGQTMMDVTLQVTKHPSENSVQVYNGANRRSYSCLPYCNPAPVLGDDSGFVNQFSGQKAPPSAAEAFLNLFSQGNSGGNSNAEFNTDEDLAGGER